MPCWQGGRTEPVSRTSCCLKQIINPLHELVLEGGRGGGPTMPCRPCCGSARCSWGGCWWWRGGSRHIYINHLINQYLKCKGSTSPKTIAKLLMYNLYSESYVFSQRTFHFLDLHIFNYIQLDTYIVCIYINIMSLSLEILIIILYVPSCMQDGP